MRGCQIAEINKLAAPTLIASGIRLPSKNHDENKDSISKLTCDAAATAELKLRPFIDMIRLESRSAGLLHARCSQLTRPTLSSLPSSSSTKSILYQPQSRTFLDSILKSSLGECPLRKLSHTKTIPHSASATFNAVADVSGYPTFLPFTISSHIISRDENGLPTRAKLRIGYEKFGLEENWDSIVHCDAQKGIVEARSSEQVSGGLFEVLQTRWQIQDNGNKQTSVKLDVDVKFRNIVYDQMFAQVEGKVASTMISAFEKKVQEVEEGR